MKDKIAEILLKIIIGMSILLGVVSGLIMMHRVDAIYTALTSPPTQTGTEQVEYTIDGYFDTSQNAVEAKHYIYLKDKDGITHTFEISTDALAVLARKNGETITVTKTTSTHRVYGEEITYDWHGFTLTYIGTETEAEG